MSALVDLFGLPREAYRGQPTDIQKPFSDDEVETILDDVVFEGFLLQDLADVLKNAKTNPKANAKDLNEQLCWVFDLYASPAMVAFDLACEIEGIDPEHMRGAISVEYGNALRNLYEAVKAIVPQEAPRIRKQLAGYIVLDAAVLH